MEYEVGLIKSFDRVHIRTAAWYYDIQDFINDNGITAPGSGAGSDCLYNIDSVELYGVELEASFRLTPKLRATAAYVYQEHQVSQTGYEQDWTYYLPATLPKHKVKVLASYEVMDQGWLQLSGRYVGDRGSQKGADLDDYLVCDIGFRKKLVFDRVKWDLNFYVSNVTGTRYEEISGYPMPKQVWGMSLAVKF